MNFSALSNQIFDKCIDNYHLTDNVDAPIQNPYELKSIEFVEIINAALCFFIFTYACSDIFIKYGVSKA